jgi:hypothetical protein
MQDSPRPIAEFLVGGRLRRKVLLSSLSNLDFFNNSMNLALMDSSIFNKEKQKRNELEIIKYRIQNKLKHQKFGLSTHREPVKGNSRLNQTESEPSLSKYIPK